MDKKDLKIVFMGTPDIAVEALREMLAQEFTIVGVVTAPDKPAGRGKKMQQSAVKKFAVEQGLAVLQPPKLKDPEFLEQLGSLQADIQVVLAFRMLPEVVWAMPRLGTFNLHASLLPQYRGAAPINWAVINGETESGVTTFFLKHEIDTGDIIYQERIAIAETDTAGILHDKLMYAGAKLICKTLDAVLSGDIPQVPQSTFGAGELKPAPKIGKDDCRIDWNKDQSTVYNHIRGFSPYPAAFTVFSDGMGNEIACKIFVAEKVDEDLLPGCVRTDGKHYLYIGTRDGAISLTEVQLAGKKRLPIDALLRGFAIDNSWTTS